jgi:hypothetical protein
MMRAETKEMPYHERGILRAATMLICRLRLSQTDPRQE